MTRPAAARIPLPPQIWTYGDAPNAPEAASDTNDPGTVTYRYRRSAGYDSVDPPTDAGAYTVYATFAANENYGSCTAAADFTIAPRQVAFTVTDDTCQADGRPKYVTITADPDKGYELAEVVVTDEDGTELALTGGYPDSAAVSAWAQNAFAWALSRGVIDGRDGQLTAGESVKRAEAAAMIMRFVALQGQ